MILTAESESENSTTAVVAQYRIKGEGSKPKTIQHEKGTWSS